jgi:hypothetical protein
MDVQDEAIPLALGGGDVMVRMALFKFCIRLSSFWFRLLLLPVLVKQAHSPFRCCNLFMNLFEVWCTFLADIDLGSIVWFQVKPKHRPNLLLPRLPSFPLFHRTTLA